jgi:hypothetical protein
MATKGYDTCQLILRVVFGEKEEKERGEIEKNMTLKYPAM